MQNFEAIAKAFVEQNGAIRVRDAAELETALGELIENEQRREELGKNALRVVKENVGAIERTVEMILKHLPSDEIYLTAPAEESNMDSSAQSTAQPLPLPSNRTTDHRAAEH
jgi:UDP-N-acetylglucosamine:LPS N-acetylglucosamine transferase